MAFNSSGQVAYLVLDSLSSGSKYGLEIIEFISKKTDGNYILKKPTLYSCLTRMEKKGLVSSSYWGESELGGKRHYYTITNEGKRELEQLSREFADTNYIAQEDPKTSVLEEKNTEKSPVESTSSQYESSEDKARFLQQENLFDLVKSTPKVEEKEEDERDVIDNQIDIFDYQAALKEEEKLSDTIEQIPDSNIDEEEKIKYYQQILEQSPAKDDAILLDESEKLTPTQEAQNRMLYDTSSELKKYRKRKSFSENQIEMNVVYEDSQEREVQKARIEQLKQAMLSSRQNTIDNMNKETTNKPSTNVATKSTQELENQIPTQDDAVYITHRIDSTEMPIQKKISPTNIEVNVFDDNLPAPKRDSNLEPTYKDMMAKLFERKKEKTPEPEQTTTIVETAQTQTFSDYSSLKKYYSSHNIEFKEYRKTNITRHHNTNFLNFVSSTILLLFAGFGCAILFGILSACQVLKSETNFMFYTLPILFLIYFIYSAIKFKILPSKKASLTYNAIINWAIALLASIIIFVINVTCGMIFETMASYSTTLLIPIFGVLLAFPINYYTKKFLYKKYGK